MYLRSESVDDMQHAVLSKLLLPRTKIVQASRGEFFEISGAMLRLKNPRARLGRGIRQGRLFSSLGELLWYLAGSNELDFIYYYIKKYAEESEDGLTIKGSYGERLFRSRQIYRVLSLLKSKSTSRRAVLQIFRKDDLRNSKEVPCTISLQFLLRSEKLDLIASMRSNDALIGLPHDVFAFTMIQEIAARHLKVEVGTYTHFVGSLHLYTSDISRAKEYISDGLQRVTPMPAMPIGDPLPRVKLLLSAEQSIRETGNSIKIGKDIENYWKDIIYILRSYHYIQKKDRSGVHRMKNKLSSDFYHQYLDMKAARMKDCTEATDVQNTQDTLLL
ncbi:thymidylate synthase [Stenotrophomonas indicatrix]|nr:thymidylate synthase [Stenotrophomonas indicatrix]